jgi:hypothetical protein
MAELTLLDWHEHVVGPLAPCRICGGLALLRDGNDEPCHKVCADQEHVAHAGLDHGVNPRTPNGTPDGGGGR